MKESGFKNDVLKPRLEKEFPNCVLIDVDPPPRSIPDLFMFWGPYWAAFETKRGRDAPKQANQPWWVNRLDQMSFAEFVDPSNIEETISSVKSRFFYLGSVWCGGDA